MSSYKPVLPEISQEKMAAELKAFRETHSMEKMTMAHLLNVPLNTYVQWEKPDGQNVRHKTILLYALKGIAEGLENDRKEETTGNPTGTDDCS